MVSWRARAQVGHVCWSGSKSTFCNTVSRAMTDFIRRSNLTVFSWLIKKNVQIGLANLLVERKKSEFGIATILCLCPNYVCFARTPCRYSPWPAVRKRMVGCLMCGDMWRAVGLRKFLHVLRLLSTLFYALLAWGACLLEVLDLLDLHSG